MQVDINVFISYSHNDSDLYRQLVVHLSPLKRSGLINLWSDRDIGAGTEREEAIHVNLERANLILLLISPDFINSEYCHGIEMKRAIEKHKAGRAHVIPVILRPVIWASMPFGGLQALPTDAKPVVSPHWPTRDEAFFDIAQGIQKVAEGLSVKSDARGYAANPQINNPFIYGKPIQNPEQFFGRADVVNSILSRLHQKGSSSLVGERRVGRTSVLNYINHPNIRQSQGFRPSEYIFVYLDAQILDKNITPMRLWQWLLQEMAQQCVEFEIKLELERMSQGAAIEALVITKLFERMDKKGLYPVFLLDEFELITQNKNFGPYFFYHLRNLATLGPLSLVTSTRCDLGELCHSEAIRSSPFFNIFGSVNIRLFTIEEARNLILRLSQGTGISFTSDDIDMILHIAGTHPYFLQIAASFLFEIYIGNSSIDKYAYLQKRFDEQTTPQLHSYWRTSDNQEKIMLLSLALLEQQTKRRVFEKAQLQDIYSHPDQALTNLAARSLLVTDGEQYGLFSASLCKWVCNHFMHNPTPEKQTYNKWLKINKHRLSPIAVKEMGDILPKLHHEYRELLISWVGQARNLVPIAKLLRTALEES